MPPPPPPARKPGQKKGKVEVFRAIYSYEAKTANELSFEEGDMIYISEKGGDGWWKGTINGKSGIIPGNYVGADDNAETVAYPLHDAAKRGNLPFLQECLTNGVSVNGLDKAGATPLHWAARGGHMECVQAILACDNVLISVQNKLGDTALHGAAWKGQGDVVALLLEKGAEPSLANNQGETAYDLGKDHPEAGKHLMPYRGQVSNANDGYDDSDEDED